MDQSNSLTESIFLTGPKQVINQSKEEFFSTKKSAKRMKSSNQLSQQAQPKKLLFQSQDINQYKIIKTIQSLNVKQLHYSLAETEDPDLILQFKSKAPKKKKIPSKIYEQNICKSPSSKGLISANVPSFVKNFIENKKVKQVIEAQVNPIKQSEQKELKIEGQKSVKLDKQLSIQDFKVLKQIGEGAYSKVYKVVHKLTGLACAIKTLQKQLMRDLNVQQNAIRQIKILMCLNNQNISSLYGTFYDQNFIYLVLQLCTDGDVTTRLKQIKNKLKSKPEEYYKQTVCIIRQIANSIGYLHQNNIIHRDIKPENVLVTLGKNVKLSDFGWAVHSQKNVLRKTLCGTPLYLAPQFIQTCSYTQNVDVWAFGVLCYQLLTNQYPFVIKKISDLVKIVQDQIDFSKIKDNLAKDFVMQALRKKSSQRAKMQELCKHEFLKQFVEND